ncbi:hypothetical protein SNE40_017809 [Patella caerulea]|uniref:Uncharacterized protein n=1 Tax=Patella caerulea TaxID=87958 RepID=A0AAN8JHS9_PATCE
MLPRKKSIVFNRQKDTFLCREVIMANPFQNAKFWDEIAEKITQKYELTKPCTKRTVADRVELLLGNWKKSGNASKMKSGEKVSYTEWESLMIGITALKDQQQQEYGKRSQVDQRLHEFEAKGKGKIMCDQAMLGMKKRKKEDFSSFDEYSEHDNIQMPEINKFLLDEDEHAEHPSPHVEVEWETLGDMPDETLELAGYGITNRPKTPIAKNTSTTEKEMQKKENTTDPFLELMARKLDLDEAREKRLEREREKNEEFQNQLLSFVMKQKKE